MAVAPCLQYAPDGHSRGDATLRRRPAAERSAGNSVQHSRDHRAHRRGEREAAEDTLAIDQTTLTRSLNLLERDGVIERASHPDARIRAMKLTSKGRRALEAARPLWARAQDKVLRELGTKGMG